MLGLHLINYNISQCMSLLFDSGISIKRRRCSKLNILCSVQISEYLRSIEKLTFWASDDRKMHTAKQELLTQIDNLRISINGKGLFAIDRPFLTGVSSYYHKFATIVFLILEICDSQMAATCCTYAIISIQFFLDNPLKPP